jgi:hypothetical protein
MAYQQSQLPSSVNEQSLRIFYNDASAWLGIPDCNVDTTAKKVTCQVTHLTKFAFLWGGDRELPAPPENITITVSEGNGGVLINWTEPSFDYHHTRIYRSTVESDIGKLLFYNLTGGVVQDDSVAPGQTYYYSLRCVDASGNVSSIGQASITLSNATFQQSDLMGTWDIHTLQSSTSSGGSGWERVVATFDGTGGVQVVSFEDSWGSVFPPGPIPIVWTVNSSGVITETEDGTPTSFHGRMTSNKQMIIGTSTVDSTSKKIWVARKQVSGVTYINTDDLYNKICKFHILLVGDTQEWEWGDATIDLNGTVDLPNLFNSNGTHFTDINFVSTLFIDADGIITDSHDSSSRGFLTPDKSILVMTGTSEDGGNTNYAMRVLTISGGVTITQSEMAGTYGFYDLFTSPSDTGWLHGKVSIDSTGSGSFTDLVDETGPRTPFQDSFTFAQDGTVTVAGNPTFHGTVSRMGNLIVANSTNSLGEAELSFLVRANPAVSVSISPTTTNLNIGETQQFAATVTGSTNTSVTWSVQEGSAGGTITSGGLYTTPSTPGTYHVVATSVADNSKSATATVVVSLTSTVWENTIGGPRDDRGYSVQQISGGGYIITGSFQLSDGPEGQDLCLLRTDASGNTLWLNTFGGSFEDRGLSVQLTTDGGFIISGYTLSFGAGMSDVY